MNNQENEQQEQQPHIHSNESDLTQQQCIQEQEPQQKQPEENQQEKEKQELHDHTISNPTLTMTSSSPPLKPPPEPPLQQQQQPFDSPPLDSTYSSSHTSYGYVFSPPEALNYQETTTYQSSSPPEELNYQETTTYQSTSQPDQVSHSYVYSPSSPDIKPAAKPPSPPPAPAAAVPVSKIGSKTEDQEDPLKKKRPFLGRKKEILKRRALLGCRVFGFLFCLASFSIMAADKNQGWAIDSFYRYREFRYCMSVTIIAFVYSGLQAYSLAYSLVTGRFDKANLRCLLDFSLDQILTYLLLSASSSAAFRVEDWESNWGKDKFPSMARSSVVLSFLAFVAFALCSLLSGQIQFTPKST
ncbi:CASP-like protein 4A1 [Ricinus communis]|uniref:CASP-like protein n=1 Tax=Ricinus communis TaxID=3988 RepID=B9RUT4_RICCO|nr:CASP-like protein 4A1 [Ricinus communis]EEF44877.1 conserved hypothetical protein [Ricinus communis]|eukprot:XP_002517335.1 CASP-like protein 4A1 [Ricinus communis]